MKVILCQDIKALGKKDTIVEVSSGYANNYLIPRKLAIAATEGNLNKLAKQQEIADEKAKDALERAREEAKKIEGKTFVVKAKTGETGRLFGAISSIDIANSISKELKFDVDRKKIVLHEPIKQLGRYELEIKIYPGVAAKFIVFVEGL